MLGGEGYKRPEWFVTDLLAWSLSGFGLDITGRPMRCIASVFVRSGRFGGLVGAETWENFVE